MLIITPDVISSFNIYSYIDYKVIQRAQQMVNEKRARVVSYTLDQAACEVTDKDGDYTVHIQLVSKKQFKFSCTCQQFDPVHLCRHVPASMIVLSQFLYSKAPQTWQYRLANALQATPRTASASKGSQYAVIFGLHKNSYYGSVRFGLSTYVLKMGDFPSLEKYVSSADELNHFLETDKNWRQHLNTPYQALNANRCVNMPPEGVAMVNLLLQASRYYIDSISFVTFLPAIGRLNAPVFQFESNKIQNRLHILEKPVEVEAALGRAGKGYILQAGLEIDGTLYTAAKDNFQILSQDPAWVLAGHFLAPVKNSNSLVLLSELPLSIPAGQEDQFREQFLGEIAVRMPIKGDVIAWEDVSGEPVPRLYLNDDEGVLRASLAFGYGEYEVPVSSQAIEVSTIDQPGSWGIVRVHRMQEKEQESYQLLTDPNFRLKRSGRESPPGSFELRARAHPSDFLTHSIPELTKAGFEIYGEEKLKVGRINRNSPSLSLHISSGIDWFDLEAVVRYGDQEVSLQNIYKALRKKEKYVKLADGSIGQIPESWLERYKHLFGLVEETPQGGLRVADFHLPLVDVLLEDAQEKQVTSDFTHRRERLEKFDRITPHDVPHGFTGELRSYQKAGLDWLYFLKEYGFGGCLADDMGLGKTIQVLAFLQSLKEEGALSAATLLVVPKSLLTNWQREAAKFTPELRFLEYVGNTRQKDVTEFNGWDVILTTYGTMLRDIELLRTYRFTFAILDESQSVKNPLAQSSKAVRLLQADHRLVMTGTPVENSTFELWSQFAFLNPGLLGNLESFKREFAGPIESDHNEDTARLLRRLVFPFILRRTKEQVAPELPPRSERVLYTDMEPAQRRLYSQIRDRYRGILLGMLETDGIDNIRMKILEGLLRLRQVSIHPALVEPTYRGEAPKFELLFEVLQTLAAENHKALIFSQFVETLHIVQRELDAKRITYAYLDGQTRDRQKQVDLFQNNPQVRFFLISLKAGGLGLNLTAADYVIHLDPWWNPAVEMQASDRAHRIGQDKPVFIYKIITRDTVEEKILQLQEKKRNLVEQLITTEESFFKSLSADDVKGLFS